MVPRRFDGNDSGPRRLGAAIGRDRFTRAQELAASGGERLAFIYNADVVERTGVVTDLRPERAEIVGRLLQSRRAVTEALEAYKDGADAGALAKIDIPEFLGFFRTPFAADFRIGSHDFVAVNAKLYFGARRVDRVRERRALVEWIVTRVRSEPAVNALVLGDLLVDFDHPKRDLERMLHVAKQLRRGREKRVRVSFPFLLPRPSPDSPPPSGSEIFRTNIQLTESFQQIGIFSQGEAFGDRLETPPTRAKNRPIWGTSRTGPDYSVLNFTELLSKTLMGRAFDDLKRDDPEAARDLIRKYEFNVSDQLPIWLRIPLS